MALALCVVAAMSVHAQRDGAAVGTAATGIITGQIVTADSPPQPVRRATVALSGAGIERSTIADDAGRFAFEALPPGRYTVRARKPAWLETAYGATRPGGAGTAVAVEAGGRRDISVTLLRGAVIEGRVTLPTGAPATRTSVRVVSTTTNGSPRGVEVAITDDRGLYRIYGIPPGDYVVQASPPVIPAMMQALHTPATREIDATIERLRGRTRPGQAGTVPPVASASPVSSGQIVYAPVFYPGVATRDHATPIPVTAGDERLGIDFVFAPTPMTRVAGRVAGPVPSMAGAQVRLQARGVRATIDAQVSADGTFVVPAVAPGAYEIVARLDPDRRVPAANEPRVVRMLDPAAAEPVSAGTLWARGEVEVAGQAVEGLHLALVPGSTMDGRLRFDAAALPAPIAGARVRLTPATQPSMPVVSSGSFTTLREVPVSPDGRFEVAGLAPGAYQVAVTLPAALSGAGWWTRSALAGDVDLLDTNVEFTPGHDVRGVDIVLSNQRSSLSGRLQLTDGRPGSEYFVIAFATDPRAWQVLSRRTHATRPADDGVFLLENVPPGDYFLAVLSDFDSTMLSAPGFFEQVAAAAVRFTLAEGERREQSFEIRR